MGLPGDGELSGEVLYAGQAGELRDVLQERVAVAGRMLREQISKRGFESFVVARQSVEPGVALVRRQVERGIEQLEHSFPVFGPDFLHGLRRQSGGQKQPRFLPIACDGAHAAVERVGDFFLCHAGE